MLDSRRKEKEWDGNGKDWKDFNSLINDLNLMDLPITDMSITWSNMRDDPCLARLDKALARLDKVLVSAE